MAVSIPLHSVFMPENSYFGHSKGKTVYLAKNMISSDLTGGFVEMDRALLCMPLSGLKVKEWF